MNKYFDLNDFFLCCRNTILSLNRHIALVALIFLASCSSTLSLDPFQRTFSSSTPEQIKNGGYYLDDGPGDNPPSNLAAIPNAVPKTEYLRKSNMQPYVVLGKTYTPMTTLEPYKERGVASWYGRRYHGKKTASGEVYDMYGMTAAHPILPIPSYVKVTNIKNKKSIIVRINDRGPFLSNRLIDLSYTAAYKLDVLNNGSALVEVETIIPRNQVTRLQRKTSALNSAGINNSPDIINVPHGSNEIYLQLAAFSTYKKADSFLARMRTEFPDLSNLLGITLKDGFFKIHAGPYSSQMLARQAANKIAQSLPMKPVLLVQ